MKTHEEIAATLRAAYHGNPIEPLRDGLQPQDAAGAYAIQQINTRFWMRAGRRIVGRKIGLTAPAVQAQLGVDQPDYGVLFADMAIPDGGQLACADTLQPKAEAEVALVLTHGLCDPAASVHDLVRATAYVLPAIEIVGRARGLTPRWLIL